MGVTVQENFDNYVSTAPKLATGSQSSMTLQDTSQFWPSNAYASGVSQYWVVIISGTGAGQQRKIIANSPNTLTISAAWATMPDSASQYVIAQVPTGWTVSSTQLVQFLAGQLNAISTQNAAGFIGYPGINVLGAARTASPAISDGCVQFSQIINYTTGNRAFLCPCSKIDNQESYTSIFAFVDFSIYGTSIQFYAGGEVTFQNSPTLNYGTTFASGTTVVTKYETQNMTDGNGIPFIKSRLKIWQAGTSEPSSWGLLYNEYGISPNGGSGYAAGPTLTLSSGSNTSNTILGNVVGGVITAGILTQNGYAQRYTTAPTITISGGGGTGATATCALDSDGFITTIAITNGGSGYNNSPVCTVTGGGGSGATIILAVNSGGYLGAAKYTNVGSGYTAAPTLTISGGSGSGSGVRWMYDRGGQTVGPYTSGYYRGVTTFASGTPPSTPMIDNYFEGSVGTVFAGGQTVSVGISDIGLSPYTWSTASGGGIVANNNGAYVKRSFTGTSIAATFAQQTASQVIAYCVDGNAWTELTLPNSTNIVSFASGLSSGNHNIAFMLIRNNFNNDRWNTPTEACNLLNWQIDIGASMGAPTIDYYSGANIYVGGDSIGEGINVDATEGTNTLWSWLYPLSKMLKMEIGNTCFGGTGFINGAGGGGNTVAFSSSYALYSAGKSKLVSGILSPAPNIAICQHAVNGVWGSLDAFNAWVNIRAICGTSAYLFQFAGFGGFGKTLFKGTNLSGQCASGATSTTMVSTTSFNNAYPYNQYQIIVVISPSGVMQARQITGAGSGGTATMPVSSAWTTVPDATYTWKLMTAVEYYQLVYPSDNKFFYIDLGTDIQEGLTNTGTANQWSNDGLHPNRLRCTTIAGLAYQAMYAAMNPAGRTEGSLIF